MADESLFPLPPRERGNNGVSKMADESLFPLPWRERVRVRGAEEAIFSLT